MAFGNTLWTWTQAQVTMSYLWSDTRGMLSKRFHTNASDLVFHFKDNNSVESLPALKNDDTHAASVLALIRYLNSVSLLHSSKRFSISYQIEVFLSGPVSAENGLVHSNVFNTCYGLNNRMYIFLRLHCA